MNKWKIEYDNDTGPGDEGFWERWTVTDSDKSFKCDDEADAKWLCDLLNAVTGFTTPALKLSKTP